MDNLVRKMVRQAYDIQKLRIATGLRVVAQFKQKFEVDEVDDDDLDAQDKQKEKLLKAILQSYERVTDGIVETSRKKNYKFDNIIQDETEVWFIESYTGLLKQEHLAFKSLEKVLDQDSFYNAWLSHVRGIGPAMAGVIISEFDPHKAKYPSSFWKYAGLDVIAVFDKEDPTVFIGTEGRCRKEQHLVEREYIAKDGTTKTKRGLTYNPWLKSKLLAVLATSFLRAGNERYVKLYQDYKFRQLQRPELQGKPGIKAISHKRALRYMIKQFLVDLHMAWRAHEGLTVSVQYGEAKLGLTHGRDVAKV